MIPVNIGTNPHFQVTHGKEPAHTRAAKEKDKEAFQSSLKSALADDDAADKLDASKDTADTKADDEKDTQGGKRAKKKAAPQLEDVAAALAFAAQQPLPKTEPAAEIPADATLAEPKIAPDGAAPVLDAKVATAPAATALADRTLPSAELAPEVAPDAQAIAAAVETAATPPAPSAAAQLQTTEAAPPPAAAPGASKPAAAAPIEAAAPAAPPTAAQAQITAQAAQATAPQALSPKAAPARVEAKATKAEPVRAAGKTASPTAQAVTSTTAEASSAPQNRPLDPVAATANIEAKDPQAPKQGLHPAKPSLAEVTAEKKAKASSGEDADMAADAARVSASVADPSFVAPVAVPADTAKNVTASAPGAGNTENTVRGLSEVDAKTEARIGAAEQAGHKRTLASGEARGQIVTAELGRVEVVAHAASHASSRVDVHVRAVEDHAKQAIAAAAESLREHVRVEVPNAAVHVERSHNDLLGNGTSARDFGGKSASNEGGEGGEGGRGGRHDAPGGREATVKTPAVSARGARVRFVL